MMWNSKRANARTSARTARWTIASAVAAVAVVGVITAAAMAAFNGQATSSPASTTHQRHATRANGRSHEHTGSDSVVLRLQDLPVRPELGEWAVIRSTGRGSALACLPARVTEGLGARSSLERRFGARTSAGGDTGRYAGRIGETVLQFADHGAAVDAMQSVASWLQDCAAPDLVKHEFLASETVENGFYETLLRSADDFCGGTDCDAVVFDREALLMVADRVVLLSLAEVGGPQEPAGLAASMHDLVDSAIKVAG
jgi:hypothetical protein